MALMVFLTVERRPVTRDELADLLWPTRDRARARQSVRQALYSLRSRLGADVLMGDDPVQVHPEGVTSDLQALEACLTGARPSECLDLYAGPFLEGLSLTERGP